MKIAFKKAVDFAKVTEKKLFELEKSNMRQNHYKELAAADVLGTVTRLKKESAILRWSNMEVQRQ